MHHVVGANELARVAANGCGLRQAAVNHLHDVHVRALGVRPQHLPASGDSSRAGAGTHGYPTVVLRMLAIEYVTPSQSADSPSSSRAHAISARHVEA